MSELQTQLKNIYIGKVDYLPNSSFRSAFLKKAVFDEIKIVKNGIEGDQVADTIQHGGLDKAIHHFPYKHYFVFAKNFPKFNSKWKQQKHLQNYCLLGENFSDILLDESRVCIGDIWQIGEVLLQISQPRQPCWKIDAYFEIENSNGLMKYIAKNGFCGWYYRVLKSGKVNSESLLCLIERPHPLLSVRNSWLARINKNSECKPKILHDLANCPELSRNWQKVFQQKLLSK